jgi:polyisoprenoid-binding protein YceI
MGTSQHELAATPRLGRYEIDTGRSTIKFRARHQFGLGRVVGTFAVRSGTVDVAEPLAASRLRVEVDAASFATGFEQRDRSVRSPAFLDTDRYPTMTFVSERVDATSIAGRLTVREVTRPVVLAIRQSTISPGGFTVVATTRIDRRDFGVTASPWRTGRRLDLTLEVACILV